MSQTDVRPGRQSAVRDQALVTPQIASLMPYQPGKPIETLARETGIAESIKLASNENPLGPSPKAREALRSAAGEWHRYPDAAAFELRTALAERLGVSLAEVVVGNGSNELLELLVRTFTTPDHHIVFAEPSFVVYKMASLAQGVPFSAVPLRDFTHDLPALAAAIESKTRLVFLANPNNPTGTHVSEAALRRFLERIPRNVIVALDEAYFEYATSTDYPDGLKLRSLHPRLVVLRTFSKIYGLAALRLGYAVMPEELADYVQRVRAPFNVGTAAQIAGLAALADHEFVERSRQHNARELPRISQELAQLGLRVAPSQANFVFVDAGRPGPEVYEALLRRGVIVRPLGDTPYLRITVGTEEENRRLIATLREVLG